MIRLVTIGGTGDAYLLCALLDAFKAHHGRSDVKIVGKARHRPIAELFGTPWIDDDEMVRAAERNPEMQATYDNLLLVDGRPFYAHPCFLRSGARIDKLTARPSASQADMYRVLLGLPLDAALAVPKRLPGAAATPGSGPVLIIPEAVSWPNTQPAFWSMLAEALRRSGRRVVFNDPAWDLRDLLRRCAGAEWVIGPQCGVMSVLVTGRFPCRKTLCSARLDDLNKRLWFLEPRTFPYAYVTKFANDDHDVEEHEITDDNHAEIVAAVVNGANALGLRPHDPSPVTTVSCQLSPGDFLDRLAVLEVKRRRFSGAKRAEVEREYRRFLYAKTTAGLPAAADEVYARMVELHDRTFSLLESLVPAALNGGGRAGDHDMAVRLNRERVALKRRVDAACRAPYSEEKSYYDAAGIGVC